MRGYAALIQYAGCVIGHPVFSLSLSELHYLSPATCFLINNSSLDVDSPLPPQENKRPFTGQTKRGEDKGEEGGRRGNEEGRSLRKYSEPNEKPK